MAHITKLHQLLSGATTWNTDLRYDVEDYLEANCTVQEVLQLCVLVNQQQAIPSSGRLDKVELLTDLLPSIRPPELLTAWETLLIERSARKEQRQADLAALDKPLADEDLAEVLRVLSPYEIAVLYYGQVQVLHDIQEAQVQGLTDGQKLPKDIRSQVELAHLARMRLDGGLDWLAHADIKKADAVATHLSGMPDDRLRRVAELIRSKLPQPAADPDSAGATVESRTT